MTFLGGKSHRRDQTGFGVIDYLLMSFGSCLAVYATCMAIGVPNCAPIFLGLTVVGTIASLGIRKLFGAAPFLRSDSLLYTAASISAVIFSGQLNQVLPADGIPVDVSTAGWLCWMLSFGSFLSWRDRTLLFQAVPTIALFGLIGCYDTYAPAPFLFFGFLLCLATLLGRSHSREMLRLAVLSGYFNRGESRMTLGEQPEQSPELYEAIKKGPWRWLAGPEWALLSGLVIVIFSLLGAPVIRQAVQPISGAMRILAPKKMRMQTASRVPEPLNSYTVGRGPLTNQSMPPVPVYMVRFDRIRYLRSGVYRFYDGHGWSEGLYANGDPAQASLGRAATEQMKDKRPFHITVNLLTSSLSVPLPAEVTRVSPAKLKLRGDGSGVPEGPYDRDFEIFGTDSGEVPETAEIPNETPPNADLERDHMSESVADFANNASIGGKTDYERAMAVESAIGARCKYYKGASAVPEGRDAADYFLNDSQEGYCDLFATAMVECARAIHIPAHFCIGYLADAKNTDAQGLTTVYDKDYHAWAELYFKNVGWVVFDATSQAQEIDPTQSAKPSWSEGIIPVAVNLMIGLIAAGIVSGLAYSSWKSRKKGAVRVRSDVDRCYARFSRVLQRSTGERRILTETADEYLARLELPLGGQFAFAKALNDRFVFAFYSPEETTADSLASMRKELKDFEANLKHQQKLNRSHGFGSTGNSH